jgi:hypothetical protein
VNNVHICPTVYALNCFVAAIRAVSTLVVCSGRCKLKSLHVAGSGKCIAVFIMVTQLIFRGTVFEFVLVHVVFGLAAGKTYDEGGHGHFDIEFDHVGDGMELDVDNLIPQKHEADKHALSYIRKDKQIGALFTYIHGDGENHKLRVESDKGLVFDQAVLLYKSDLDGSEEVPVERSIHDEYEHLGNLVPVFVDIDIPRDVSKLCL